MPQLECTSKLLNLQGILVDSEKISEDDDKIIVPISTEPSEQTFPCCGEKTSRVHDYRTEGKHNLIKTLKRNAFGFGNFENMRKRILLCA